MSSNAQKTAFQRSLHDFGDVKSQDWQARLPKSMPATVTKVTNALVTVKLDGNWAPYSIPEITVPQAGSRYVREPTKVGDKGIVIGVDFYIGGQSGEGGGTADTTPRANLTNAVFQPITQKDFPTTPDGVAVVSGPNGAELKDDNGKATLKAGADGITGTTTEGATLTASKDITLNAGQAFELDAGTTLTLKLAGVATIVFNSSGATLTGDLTVTGNISATGTIHADGNITSGGDMTATGNVHATNVAATTLMTSGTVTATLGVNVGLIGLTTHHHISAAPGVSTSAPIP